MTPTKDGYVLSTGREFYANNGIIGLSPEFGRGALAEGYDGGILCEPNCWNEAQQWTAAERTELADYMIALWMKWRDQFGATE